MNIGDEVEKIPDCFVYGCSGLVSVEIPNSVTSIGSSAFQGCSGLTSIAIGNSVTSIGGFAFSGCSSLTSITIPQSVTSINKQAFKDCSKIKTVTIYGCPDIEDENFAGCPRISNVYVHSMEAPYLGNGVFEEEVKLYANLHIPTGTEDVYAVAYGWREFQNVKADIELNEEDKYTTFSIHFAGQGIVEQTVRMHEALTLLVTADENSKINTVLYNGEDVTDQIIGGHFTTPLVNGPATLVISVEVVGDGIQYATSPNVKVYGRDGSLYISGLEDNTDVLVYDLNGVLQLNENVDGDTRLSLADGVYVVKIGNRTFKVAM